MDEKGIPMGKHRKRSRRSNGEGSIVKRKEGRYQASIEKAELDFQLEKFGYKNGIEKKAMEDILKLFSEFNLIEVIGKVGEPDCRIKLYPSLQFCLSDTEFQRFTEQTASKMQERRSRGMTETAVESLTDEEDDDE